MVKYILVTGGVISGIGKGIIASSTGVLLKSLGLNVTAIKIDPYLNIDAGTLSPLDHGEVFVLKDGGEVDLDLGNYERFLDVTLTRDNNITTGKVYRNVIEKERKGDYLGKTVQVVPHITDAIQDWVERVAKIPVDRAPDVCIIELGGTVGDIESAPFVEAMRQFQFRVGHDNFCLIHVSLIPVVGSVGEQKTKPTQSSVRDLRGLGLNPDIIACRSSKPLEADIQSKISMFCHVPPEQVLAVHDCKSIYHVPILLESQGLLDVLQRRLKLNTIPVSPHRLTFGGRIWHDWKELTRRQEKPVDTVTIAIVGKYTNLQDSYCSVVKALEHASLACNHQIQIKWVEATDLEPEMEHKDPIKYHQSWQSVCIASGILVPGGFGTRGKEGKIAAAKWARENKIPYLGICLGMQLAVVEFARNVCGMDGADSAEFVENAPIAAVVYMPEISKTHLGGTMRLGDRPTLFVEGKLAHSKIRALYGGNAVDQVHERHRHRYEVNPEIVDRVEAKGMLFVGRDETGERMEIMELNDPTHPYFVGVQYHPEYLTRPLYPSPPFIGLIQAASKNTRTFRGL
ncbi:CTP synthase [Dimargaris cristalligena]|uniref:CTP synthase n=1 Tax=Dimargaris cristalligena TaxID=215637 RepID=A0A4P9ZZY4_9FUNG|nr:CTP synthase [Dimargaris cristalligena]|eukprot:RKP39315.1 CTP synthase [Dimargaris cristalligena]